MKYLDEYSYGIYPYIPEHLEQEEIQAIFKNIGNTSDSQTGYGNPDTIRQFQNLYGDNFENPPPPESQKSSGTMEQSAPDPLDNSEEEDDYGNRYWKGPKPIDFGERKRTVQPNPHPVTDAMPADPYPYNYPQNMNLALDLIREALSGENDDKLFYSQLLNAAPVQEDRDIITGIRNDEMKHFELFRKLYYEHTGKILRAPAPYENGIRMNYCEGLKKALEGEVKAVGKYRKILFAMQDRRDINILTEILTDEIRHADLYGLLFSLNICNLKQGNRPL